MKGRPVLGAISGLFFGLFVALDLIFFRLVDSDTVILVIAPVVGMVMGLGLAAWAPFGGRRPEH